MPLNLDQFRDIKHYPVIIRGFLKPQGIQKLLLQAIAWQRIPGNIYTWANYYVHFPYSAWFSTESCSFLKPQLSNYRQILFIPANTTKAIPTKENTFRLAKAPYKSSWSTVPCLAQDSRYWLPPLNPATSRYDSLLSHTNHQHAFTIRGYWVTQAQAGNDW